MSKLRIRKIADWSGIGQFRKVLLFAEQVLLVGGVNPILGRRSNFKAIAVAIDIKNAKENWQIVTDKSYSFQHATIQGNRLILTIPSNFTHGFTGYIQVDIESGKKETEHRFDEVILGAVSLGGKLFFGTALRGIFRVFSTESEGQIDFPRPIDSRFWLLAISAIENNTLVLTEYDHTLSRLTYTHSAFDLNGERLWRIDSDLANIASMDRQFLVWDGESATAKAFDSKTGGLRSVVELGSPPLEIPIAIGEYGFAYACADCSIHLRSWQGDDQEILQQPTSGSIALAYDKVRKTLVAAFSGNNNDPTTQVSLIELLGV
jgi:hypothetical protein